MKVVIAGSRYKECAGFKLPFDDYSLLIQTIERSGYDITEVVSGKAIGADTLGETWARANSVPIKEMPAMWNSYGKAAGAMRNRDMAEYADAAIILWDGKSTGTKNMINEMIRLKKPYYVGFTTMTVEDFF